MSPARLSRLGRASGRAAHLRLREARWIAGAARAHRAPLPAVAARASRLRRQGWHVGDLALLGLLDPRQGPARERWAVRRGEVLALQEALNPAWAVPETLDKRRFAAACARRGIATPPLAAVLERSGGRRPTAAAWARALAERAPAEAVVKPASAELGAGVRVLRRQGRGARDAAGRRWSWDDLAADLARARHEAYVVQPRLRPCAELRRLSGSEVLQCLRIVTLLDERGRAEVLYAVLRISASAAVVDSFRAPGSGATGNLIARVERDGTLAIPVGVAPGGYGLVRVAVHPATGVALPGRPAPGWEAARALALRAAEAFAPVRTVGWDVAVTDEGPVVVEGNAWWGATGDPDGALLPVRDALRRAVAAAGSPAGAPT